MAMWPTCTEKMFSADGSGMWYYSIRIRYTVTPVTICVYLTSIRKPGFHTSPIQGTKAEPKYATCHFQDYTLNYFKLQTENLKSTFW